MKPYKQLVVDTRVFQVHFPVNEILYLNNIGSAQNLFLHLPRYLFYHSPGPCKLQCFFSDSYFLTKQHEDFGNIIFGGGVSLERRGAKMQLQLFPFMIQTTTLSKKSCHSPLLKHNER